MNNTVIEQIEIVKNEFPNDYEQDFLKSICSFQKEIRIEFPVKLSNGIIEIFEGIRVQHNNWRGPYKGGIRFSPHVNVDECKGLAFWMTLKSAIHQLPLGGGKGGIKFNPKDYVKEDVKKITTEFVKALYLDIGPYKDIPAPDMSSTATHMNWMNHEYKELSHSTVGCFTGKSIEQGGCIGRNEATGYGVYHSIKLWYKHIYNKNSLENETFVLQGFGNVGYWTAYFLEKDGAKIVGVADHTGFYQCLKNVSVGNLKEHQDKEGSLQDLDNCFPVMRISRDNFWGIKCSILIPAALELQITSEIVPLLQCKLIAEGANGPCFPNVDKLCKKRNIDIIPDFYCNSAGVIVSYFEWIQNIQHSYWSYTKVMEKLNHILNDTFQKFLNYKQKFPKTTSRILFYKMALDILQEHYNLILKE